MFNGIPTTVSNNPGAFKERARESPRKALSHTLYYLRRGQIREAWNLGVISVINILNARFRQRQRPRFHCSCCGYIGYSFVHLSNRMRIAWNSACPACDARSRHRGLARLLPKLLSESRHLQRILHIAPEPVLRHIIQNSSRAVYHTSDLYLQDVDYPRENLEALSFPGSSYDLVICNHVLEHVPHDDLAVSEISRILTPQGKAVITIPGDWQRPKTVVFAQTDLNGHYRDYGKDVRNLFLKYFAAVDVIDMHKFDRAPDGLSCGIRKNDIAFICKKTHDA